MIDEEWPALKAAYEQWLAPENFDAHGRQKTRLSELTAAALARLSRVSSGPRRAASANSMPKRHRGDSVPGGVLTAVLAGSSPPP